jgi:hypothetical protein
VGRNRGVLGRLNGRAACRGLANDLASQPGCNWADPWARLQRDSLGSVGARVTRGFGAADGESVVAHSGAHLHEEVHEDTVHLPGMADTAAVQHYKAVTGEADLTGARRRPSQGRRRGCLRWSR